MGVTLVKLVVGDDGRMLRVQSDPPAQLRQIDPADAFVAAIEVCTRQWRFAPLIVTTTRTENGHRIRGASGRILARRCAPSGMASSKCRTPAGMPGRNGPACVAAPLR